MLTITHLDTRPGRRVAGKHGSRSSAASDARSAHLQRPLRATPALALLLSGSSRPLELTRGEAVKQVWAYAKRNGLQVSYIGSGFKSQQFVSVPFTEEGNHPSFSGPESCQQEENQLRPCSTRRFWCLRTDIFFRIESSGPALAFDFRHDRYLENLGDRSISDWKCCRSGVEAL